MNLKLLCAEIGKEINERFDNVRRDLEAKLVLHVQAYSKANVCDGLEAEKYNVQYYPEVHPMPIFIKIKTFLIFKFKNEHGAKKYHQLKCSYFRTFPERILHSHDVLVYAFDERYFNICEDTSEQNASVSKLVETCYLLVAPIKHHALNILIIFLGFIKIVFFPLFICRLLPSKLSSKLSIVKHLSAIEVHCKSVLVLCLSLNCVFL